MVVVTPLRPAGPSRERLARTAMRMFAERGYDGVSNREIVAACGLTKGAIYWYFESKEDLYATVVAEALQSFQQRVVEALADSAPWDARLGSLFSLFVEVLQSDDDPHRDLLVLMVHRFRRGPGADSMIAGAYEQLTGWVQQVLAERGGDPEVHAEDAALVCATGLGVLVEAAAGRRASPRAFRGLLRGLGGRAPELVGRR
jgi:AcrR family transcriptional regulator